MEGFSMEKEDNVDATTQICRLAVIRSFFTDLIWKHVIQSVRTGIKDPLKKKRGVVRNKQVKDCAQTNFLEIV